MGATNAALRGNPNTTKQNTPQLDAPFYQCPPTVTAESFQRSKELPIL